MQPLISVIVPIYKVEKYLRRCIDSILNQTYENLEVILVDDGSPDNCPSICDDYAKKDSRVVVLHKENGGLSDARNAGMEIAQGEYISFVDSDDYISKEMLFDLYDNLIKSQSEISSCGVKWVKEDGSLLNTDVVDEDKIFNTEEAMWQLLNSRCIKAHVWNKLYKKEIAKSVLFEKGKYHEDIQWAYQIIAKTKKVSVINSAYYYYVQRANSITTNQYSEKRLDGLYFDKKRCEFIKENFPKLYKNSLRIFLESCMHHTQIALKGKSKSAVEKIKDIMKIKLPKDIFNDVPKSQKCWLRLFTLFPVMTCRIRNLLKIGF